MILVVFAGPILRAEVGERIQVVFKNKASKSYSVHAHGVKTSEPHQTGVPPGLLIIIIKKKILICLVKCAGVNSIFLCALHVL